MAGNGEKPSAREAMTANLIFLVGLVSGGACIFCV